LDLHMPGLDGFGVMEQLKGRIAPSEFVPILVLTADITPQARKKALSAGAKDFLTKPVDPTEVVLRIKNLLQT
ncbi:MAG: response regulator, partial [Gemmatimonadetes bacterium]|nr:response regulator [Gemmatimonadota bacterium]NIQ55616.1 response regulator [Gemmatimonadota bacterium]NIU75825.1 response regulator [Gammaproteobacteria bacterium]NIX45462.1 response regulator [Gemmatimonadota bacterium]NIY08978.1 response regulator [Gemmatimonadota bacterium]